MSVQTAIGKTIDFADTPHRDAIHIAVAPVVAAENLRPGDRIGFVHAGDVAHVGKSDSAIGIVDPFLTATLLKGTKFWMFLLPNTITSLRHEWVHPAFGDSPEKNDSKVWIEAFAEELDQTYSRLMGAAQHWLNGEHEGQRWNDNYTYDNTEAYKDVDYAKWPIFWKHYEIVTGVKVKDHTATFFTCSC